MAAIEEHIDQLIETVKLFPPYPEGDNSEERIKMLRSFNGIRQLIDQLTVPAKDDLGQAIMADPNWRGGHYYGGGHHGGHYGGHYSGGHHGGGGHHH